MLVGCSSNSKVETNAMPVHDWTRVDEAIVHDFQQAWITEQSRVLNRGLLPADRYALVELHATKFGSDVPRLVGSCNSNAADPAVVEPASDSAKFLLAAPKLQPTAETDMAFYRRKQ